MLLEGASLRLAANKGGRINSIGKNGIRHDRARLLLESLDVVWCDARMSEGLVVENLLEVLLTQIAELLFGFFKDGVDLALVCGAYLGMSFAVPKHMLCGMATLAVGVVALVGCG